MAIFSKKTKKSEKSTAVVKTGDTLVVRKDNLLGVIVRPRITEKATLLAEKANTYVFEVNDKATKPLIAKVIRTLYSVSPVSITIARNPAKKVIVRNKQGQKSGVKKAYVTLKKGEKIEFA